MKMRKIASMEIWNQPFYIGPVLSFLDQLASKHSGMEFDRYNRMRYVIGAVLEKRIARAYPGTSGTIDVELLLSDTHLEVSIKDKGVPAWTDLSYNDDLDANDRQGVRNYFLDRLVDSIGSEKLGKDGQRIYIRQQIKNRIHFDKPEPYPETEVLDTDISIRPVVTKEDAIEAIRCIYSEYGYSYSYEKLYYVDSFINMIQNGELMSFLAVNEHGQTAGHFALSFSDTFKNMPEISTVVTRKEFRGLGLFARFMDHCLALGEKHGFRALMGQPVAFHPMSQKAFLKAGFTATSVLLSYLSPDVESEYNKDGQRLDLFASVRIIDKNAHTIAYPPTAIYPFVDKVFSKLGWVYELRQEHTLRESTQISVEHSGSLRSTKVLIYGAGADLKQILEDTVRDLIRRKNEMIELLILLNDPSCEHSFETAKSCGFILSGLIPGSESGDHLVMQMLIGTGHRYDHLVTVGDFDDLTRDIIALDR